MAINKDIIQGKWTEIKGEMRKAWGELTDNDLDQTKGNFESLVGLVHQRFGVAKEEVTTKINSFIDRFSHDANDKIDTAKDRVKSA